MDTSAKPSIAFFLPAWNEAENLPFVVGEAVDHLDKQGHEFVVIIVNDGSKDDTSTVCKRLESLYGDKVRTETHIRNLGYGGALQTGLKTGLAMGYDWIGFCDADGQFAPQEVSKLLNEALSANADVAIGFRIKRADNWTRKLIGHAWQLLSRAIVKHEAFNVDCGFKLFKREGLKLFADQLTAMQGAAISPEIMRYVKEHQLRVVNVGVTHGPRRYGKQSGAKIHVAFSSIRELNRINRKFKRALKHHDSKEMAA